jgi:hypothetical protein
MCVILPGRHYLKNDVMALSLSHTFSSLPLASTMPRDPSNATVGISRRLNRSPIAVAHDVEAAGAMHLWGVQACFLEVFRCRLASLAVSFSLANSSPALALFFSIAVEEVP